MIVLLNGNSYLGGGETLLTRFAEYLAINEVEFAVICTKGSFIEKKLFEEFHIREYIGTISEDINYYYSSDKMRELLIDEIVSKIPEADKVNMVTFCMRDLYTAFALAKRYERISVTHLILHVQDDLYLGQTLLDKAIYYLTKKRFFNNRRMIDFNRKLLSILNKNGGLICMAEVISKYWNNTFEIIIKEKNIIPLPSFIVEECNEITTKNRKSIIWIGRIIDFKIPSLIAMIEFIADNIDYTFTIIGDGDIKKIQKAIIKNKIKPGRINILGEVYYNDLSRIVKNHSIGYAMGTSLIELAKHKIPVIVALASFNHTEFKSQICGGLFYNKPKGCDGSDLILTEEKYVTDLIIDSVREIEKDYFGIANACFNYAKDNFSTKENFENYCTIIQESKNLNKNDRSILVPKSPLLRKYLFKLN